VSAYRKHSKTRLVHSRVERLRSQAGWLWDEIWAWLGVEPNCMWQWVGMEVLKWRERRYSPMKTLRMFIGQVVSADQSCQDAVARETGCGDQSGGQSTGPYCRARQRLPLKLLQRLVLESGERLRARQATSWRWHGREVKLVDGTTVSMPDTKKNQACFPQSRTQKAGLGFPVARLVAVVSLSCGAVLKWATGPCAGKASGETSMLRELAHGFGAGDLVMADRYYAGYFMLATLIECGADIVIRQHQLRKTDFRRGKRLGKSDHVVDWPKPVRPRWMDHDTYIAMPDFLTLREVRVADWVIVTSLIDAKTVSRMELGALYPQRWQIELDLRSIKSVMQMAVLRCLTPDMVKKEIAVHLLAYNLIRAAMAQTAVLYNTHPRQLSFKAAMQLLRASDIDARRDPGMTTSSRYDLLLCSIASNVLPRRPGRVEPRVKKRRSSNYPLMIKRRQELRKPLIKQKDRIEAALR
jgi:hypothetical protein